MSDFERNLLESAHRIVLLPATDLPEFFLKAYDTEAYADALATSGRLRMGSLESYQKTEDQVRKDVDEGQLRTIDQANGVTHTRTQINPKFLFGDCLDSGPVGCTGNGSLHL